MAQTDPLAPVTWGVETASPLEMGMDRTATTSAPVLLDSAAVMEPADASATLKPTMITPLDRLEPALVTEYLQGADGNMLWRRFCALLTLNPWVKLRWTSFRCQRYADRCLRRHWPRATATPL